MQKYFTVKTYNKDGSLRNVYRDKGIYWFSGFCSGRNFLIECEIADDESITFLLTDKHD